ncbi:hypothetical protein BJX99DRAFT_261171 [Aspergillus californicus]
MRFILTATLIITLTSSILASIDIDADSAVTGTWKDSRSFLADLKPRANDSRSEGHDDLGAKKRKVAVDPYTVPYSLQTGPTRYAPLAKKPGTAIVTASPAPQFPTSPYEIATKYLRPGTVETTLTASETLSVTMRDNRAAPATHPAR